VSFVKIYRKQCDTENGVLYGMFFLGHDFVPGRICRQKSKEAFKKTLKT